MDLNSLYSSHQASLMRAAASGSRTLRAAHLAAAGTLAGQIACIQHKVGAAASTGWFAMAPHGACECAA